MPPDRKPEAKLETDGALVRPIGGQIYLVEEDNGDIAPLGRGARPGPLTFVRTDQPRLIPGEGA